MLKLWAIVLCMGLVVPVFGAELPEELSFLKALEEDEGTFVEAAHVKYNEQKASLEAALNPSSTIPNDDVEEVRKNMQRQMELMDIMWNYVLSFYPNNAQANNYFGEFLYDYANRQIEAVNYWRKASILDKKFGSPLNNLGIHYFHNGQIKMGNEYLSEALEVEPKNPDYNFNMAQMYLNHFPQLEKSLDISRERVYKTAMKYSQRAARSAPEDYLILEDYAVNFYAAENFDVKANWKRAAAAWAAARAHARNDQDLFFTHLNEGRVWFRDENYSRASQSFLAALEIRSDNDVALRLLESAKAKL